MLKIGLLMLFCTPCFAVSQQETQQVYQQIVRANGLKALPLVFKNDSRANASYYKGVITVNTGMLKFARNRAEIAAVLGHELGHSTTWVGSGWYGEYLADYKSSVYMSRAGYNVCQGFLLVKRFNSKGSKTHPPSNERYSRICK